MDSNYLVHHGIKGMKWGIRRYQDADGNLTEAGKARYFRNGKRKTAERMTTADLERSNKRLKAELDYKNYSSKVNNSFGKKALSTLLKAGATFAAVYGGTSIAKKVSKGKVFSDNNRNIEIAISSALTTALADIGINESGLDLTYC